MSNLVLTCSEGGNFAPHPEGIHPGVCVDVVDLGLVETEFQGQRRLVNKVKVVFETEQKGPDGMNCTAWKSFTASLHPKSKLVEFLGKWRGRPVLPGETVELERLLGASCTLVISHQQNMVGRTYASIDAVSKPTKKVTPSGQYDPAAARQRYAEWKAKHAGQAGGQAAGIRSQESGVRGQGSGGTPQPSPLPGSQRGEAVPARSSAPVTAPAAAEPAFDPDVGF